MDASELLIKLVMALALAGGFGYINYYILQNIGVINISKEDKDDKSFSLILFSVLNVLLFIMINSIFGKDVDVWILVSGTMILTIVLSFTIFKWMMKGLFSIFNKTRKKEELGEISNSSVRTLIFDNNRVLFVYMYELDSDKLLAYGCMGWQNESKEYDFEMEIIPTDKAKRLEFNEAMEMAQKNDDVSLYVNVDKKIKIVVIPEPKE
ncbi:hypothetical protein MKA31_13035 [[Clostridium] innocuum]|uniref:hypothetical protein n=1 Tax=Clostridium innocuum TaxID=1522 RepID=UPI0021485998|nr:hypothetical protein [[Clostridium] innocuum]MCR0162529.1 hypothetical protein [[Clostridium] innocuum]MCR0273008.1 hypothetical protein [[Clostridium] innocuum]